MIIQWYPGHMAKARRQIQESLKLIDIVIELTDARIPQSARNPDIPEIHHKPYILAVTKCDLADPKKTDIWTNFWRNQNENVVLLDLLNGKGIKQLRQEIRRILPQSRRAPRVLVLGVPNVGKSSLINRLTGRSGTRVGAKPGVTRGKQWINANGMQLLDTPGILWPNLADQEVARKLAVVASIRDEVLDWEGITYWLLEFLILNYPDLVNERYNVDPNPESLEDVFLEIGRKRGCLLAKGEIDRMQTAQLLLKEFRTGIIGRITLELPQKDDIK